MHELDVYAGKGYTSFFYFYFFIMHTFISCLLYLSISVLSTGGQFQLNSLGLYGLFR